MSKPRLPGPTLDEVPQLESEASGLLAKRKVELDKIESFEALAVLSKDLYRIKSKQLLEAFLKRQKSVMESIEGDNKEIAKTKLERAEEIGESTFFFRQVENGGTSGDGLLVNALAHIQRYLFKEAFGEGYIVTVDTVGESADSAILDIYVGFVTNKKEESGSIPVVNDIPIGVAVN